MFHIETYLKLPQRQITDLKDVKTNPSKYFIEISQHDEVYKYFYNKNLFYLDGVIVLKYYDQILTDYDLWDYVDQLWVNYLTLIESVIKQGYGKTYFPDQPIEVEFQSIPHNFLLFKLTTHSTTTWKLPQREFISSMLDAANIFFDILVNCLGLVTYYTQISQIKELRNLAR